IVAADGSEVAHPADRRLDSQGMPPDNARLIAAAPDYFDGVEEMLMHEDCGGDGWWCGWQKVVAAHAKAKGGALSTPTAPDDRRAAGRTTPTSWPRWRRRSPHTR